jgi:hypothetical protein
VVNDSTKKGVSKAINVEFGQGIRGIVGRLEIDARVYLFSTRHGSMVLVNDGCRGTRGYKNESEI